MYFDEWYALKKCFNCIFAMWREDLSSLRGRFAPEDMAPFPSDERVNSCAQCAGMVGEIREREPEDMLNSPLEQLHDLLAIRALSLCPVNLWVERKSAFYG